MSPRPASFSSRLILLFVLLLFFVSLTIRVLFWKATPDSAWAYSAFYKGDAPVWLEYARTLSAGGVFEWGLPLRPPGMAYLVQLLWNGEPDGVSTLRLTWCVLGAVVPVVFFLAAYRGFGFLVAALAGVGMAASTGLLFLSASLNNETPYLLLVGLSLLLLSYLHKKPRLRWVAVWAGLQGVACLVRVEHLLFAFLCLGWILLLRGSPGVEMRRRWLILAVAVGCFVLPLVPWHLSAWNEIRRFNTEPQDLGPEREAAIQQIEAVSANMTWEPEAVRLREALPGFARHFWGAAIQVAVGAGGETHVTASDFDVLEAAYGSYPEGLRPFPFVTLYGPLNFYLANNHLAGGGFDRNILEEPPPLTGGEDRYPAFFTAGVPPEDALALWYPPHLEAINHGYTLGLSWIGGNPGGFLKLAGRKLGRFWSGASLGYTGYGFPVGAGGIRPRVDLTVARGGAGTVGWRLVALGFVIAGVVASRGKRAIYPWLFFVVANALVVSLFFGYARTGAMVLPAVFVLGAAGLVRFVIEPVVKSRWSIQRSFILCVVLLSMAVVAERIRFSNPPEIFLRGRQVGAVDPYPEKLYLDQEINLTY